MGSRLTDTRQDPPHSVQCPDAANDHRRGARQERSRLPRELHRRRHFPRVLRLVFCHPRRCLYQVPATVRQLRRWWWYFLLRRRHGSPGLRYLCRLLVWSPPIFVLVPLHSECCLPSSTPRTCFNGFFFFILGLLLSIFLATSMSHSRVLSLLVLLFISRQSSRLQLPMQDL